jgi:glycosyltransferase involved in cell wall biosynthesis
VSDPKTLFIHHGRLVGGAPTSLKNTALALKSLGFSRLKILCTYPDMKPFFQDEAKVEVGDFHSPHLIVGRVLNGWATMLNWRTFILFFLELIRAPLTIYRQVRCLRAEDPDIVHLNSSILIVAALSAKLAGYPVVWHVREVLLGGKYNLRRRLAGWIIRRLADRVICISEVEARSLGPDIYGNVSVVYNFVDFSSFHSTREAEAELLEKFELKADKPIYLSLGGCSFRKGTVEIIEAAEKMPDAQFVIAGTTPGNKILGTSSRLINVVLHRLEDLLMAIRLKAYYSWAYDQRISRMMSGGRAENVYFVGRMDFVPPVIAISDAVMFAGCTPHFPRPVYEAWVLEKPVVIFDMEGVSDNVDDCVDGVVAPRRDARGLLEALSRTSLDMGKKGRIKALEKFDMQKNTKQIVDIYGSLE